MVLVDESAQNVAPTDRRASDPFHRGRRIRWIKIEASVRSSAVVVLGIRAEDALQVTPAEDEDVVETLPSSSADPALGERIRPRRSNRCLHNAKTFGPEDLVEGPRELRVSIPNEEVLVIEAADDRQVPSLLGDLGGVGSGGPACHVDPSGGELDEDQDVERL
jgi:hypothetical protein